MTRIAVDSRAWPLAFVTFPSSFNDSELLAYLDELRELRVARQHYGLVLDISSSQPLTPTQRKLHGDYIADEAGLPRLYLKAVAFVAPKAIHRGILTAIFWLHKPPMPHQAFSDIEGATAWVRCHLTKEGESFPPQSTRNRARRATIKPK